MTRIDQFESKFLAAAKERYRYRVPPLRRVVLVTDEGPQGSQALTAKVKGYLGKLRDGVEREWTVLCDADYSSLAQLLEKLKAIEPDLLITSRCIKEEDKNPPYSLGVYLDVLAQATPYPTLVLPNASNPAFDRAFEELEEVLVVTDHLTGDDRLIDYGVAFVSEGGKLVLSHVEDDARFARWMKVIAKVPEIDTDTARQSIQRQLLAEPRDYIHSCVEVLEENEVPVQVVEEVRLGHLISDYQDLIQAHEADLLVLNSKDPNQLAMPGRAYAITVEFQHIPILLL